MKRFLTLTMMALMILNALPGCGSAGDVIDYDLVFVNHSDSTIVEVVVQFADRTSGTRNANSSPLKRGETFGFEAGAYPATLLVYDRAIVSQEREPGEIAQIVIPEAPPEGERWYVTAQDKGDGIALTVGTHLPPEV